MPKIKNPNVQAKHEIRKQKMRDIFKEVEKEIHLRKNEERQNINEKDKHKNERKKINEKERESKNINLSKSEVKGLRSLQKRVTAGEIVITSTDKSSRFAVLTPDQYIGSGLKHVEKDREITID